MKNYIKLILFMGWMPFAPVIFVSFCFLTGCYEKTSTTTYQDAGDIVIIEGCEYIKCYTHNSYETYTHKGNCTNCWARMETLIKNQKLEMEK